MHEIFKKLSNRMVGAMMIHTQLTELFNFIDFESDAKRQKKQLHEETDITKKFYIKEDRSRISKLKDKFSI